MAAQFRSTSWDPILIISQIITMQCIFYFGFGFCTLFVDLVTGSLHSLDQMFSYQAVSNQSFIYELKREGVMLNFRDVRGELLIAATFLNSLIGSLGLWYVIQRTKLCWDFTATVYILHVIICWSVNKYLSTSIFWWLLTCMNAIVMTVLGEYLCMKTELKAIPLVGTKVDL
ncbi:hypothetical protein HELRODRAFT_70208 [Helobdella robusta]|uniref:Protein SYS1 homolog n=1 Tax=Helobdella robusta TaxID=6412 RepID=T1G033_HELRO|nr:hypothetical protein HELRODRAFT_70208 [Helobdella robusta]ESN91662.1 hypothetical protein HELRODRAFT_70208 [Helobdella robusta]